MESTQTPLFQWSAPVKPHFERGHRWYVVASTTVLVIAAYGILSGSWSIAVVAILCGAIYFLLRDHVPRQAQCAFYESGVFYDGQFYQWEQFAGFWILETPEYNELRLCYSQKKNDLAIQMGTLSVEDMKLACGVKLTELTEKKESLIDIFSRLAKL